jgi:hypothetical protein
MEFVWESITDFHHYPEIMSTISSVHCLKEDPGKAITCGTRWRETRSFRGRPVIITKTVTSVDDEQKDFKIVSIHSGFTEPQVGSADLGDAVYTSTFAVKRTAPQRCELHGSYAALYGPWKRRLVAACLEWYLPKAVDRAFDAELKDFANEALARYRRSQVNKNSGQLDS